MIKGIIFDYNGTLFFDDDLNKIAWNKIVNKYSPEKLKDNNFVRDILSINNRNIIETMFVNKEIEATEELIEKISLEKEQLYKELVLNCKRTNLSPGAKEFLNYCVNNNYLLNICTASIKFNVDFYIENTKIDRWFDINKISYDNGKVTGKVEMYKKAAENIGVDPKNCLVFEDSPKSIKDAIKAGYDKIIYLNHNKPHMSDKEVLFEINDFTDIDYSILMKY